jgi:transcriptional regulator with XRE-family HTH domain
MPGRSDAYIRNMEIDPKRLGQAIKRARLNAGMTQEALAGKLGTTKKRIGKWEHGEPSALGRTEEARFAVAAQVAGATGDFSLIGRAPPEEDLVSLGQDVADLALALERLAIQVLGQNELATWSRYMPTLLHSEVPSHESENGEA